jgi:micrococcal nuclease
MATSAPDASGATISASEAKDHVGKTVTVCGEVASVEFDDQRSNQPTFLNLDREDDVFKVVILPADRPKFGDPGDAYDGKRICVTGLVKLYRGTPEIIAREPSQIAEDAK